MNNIEQFSLYTAKIFDVLYGNFPVPTSIDENEIISEYLLFDKHEELKELQHKKNLAELLVHSFDEEEQKKEISAKLPVIQANCDDLESEKTEEQKKQKKIYQGTINFLIAESLIHVCSHGGYRLTSKSFSHLNKTFKDGTIEGDDSSYIVAIKNIFSQTSSISKDVAVGVAINVIPKILGYS